ncbi:MAG: OmpA family protein [Bacteroidales bacterium]|nr:OmpA family protein [Bacteroidales bacterium]
MNSIKIVILFISLLAVSTLTAQDLSKKNAGQLKNLGKNALKQGDTYSAIDYYEAYLTKKAEDFEIMLTLAKCYQAARNYEKAQDWYKKAYDTNNEKAVEALYHYGCMLMVAQKYDDAYSAFKSFKKDVMKLELKELDDYKSMAGMKMLSCDTAQKILNTLLIVWTSHIDTSINKASVEFSPIFYNDTTLIYASLRSDTAVYSIVGDTTLDVPVRQFYLGKKKTLNWYYSGSLDQIPANIPNVNTGNGAFSPDKNRFYFTRCEKNWKYDVICKIYKTEKKGNKWSEPELLPEFINLPDFTSTQPTVGSESKKNEEVLYFVSNRPEGKGGMDIWYATYNESKKVWRTAKNCGSSVNTKGNEVTPYYDFDSRTLYFSSDGFITIGELDINKATGEMNKWLPAENIGYPINSSYDDLYFVLNTNKEDGFFVSNRPGGVNSLHPTCCDDIYSFKYNEVIKVAATGQVYIILDDNIKEMFTDKFETAEILPDKSAINDSTGYLWAEGVVVSLYLIDTKNKDLIYIKNDTTDKKGSYFFNLESGKEYALEFENYGNFNKKIKVDTRPIFESDTLILQPIGVNLMPKQPMIVKNIYYDFDKSILTTSAKRVIDSTLLVVLKETPQIVIEISSHTDSKGNDEYNKKLSQERAQSVVDYLIKKGIDSKRLYAKGYGEEKSIAPNENPDGSDNPVGREKNRRTEFRILGSLEQYSEIIYEE